MRASIEHLRRVWFIRAEVVRGTSFALLVATVCAGALLTAWADLAQAHPSKTPRVTKQIKRALPKLRKKHRTEPRARLASYPTGICGSGPCYSCPRDLGNCWPMLDSYASSVVNVNAGGLPPQFGLFGHQPAIYPRNGRSSQLIAMQWGLQFKTGSPSITWDDWYFARVNTDSNNDTDYVRYGGFGGVPYHLAVNARTGQTTDGLNISTNAWFGRAGIPVGSNAYRMRLQIAWYNADNTLQTTRFYVVPFFGAAGDNWFYRYSANGWQIAR